LGRGRSGPWAATESSSPRSHATGTVTSGDLFTAVLNNSCVFVTSALNCAGTKVGLLLTVVSPPLSPAPAPAAIFVISHAVYLFIRGFDITFDISTEFGN